MFASFARADGRVGKVEVKTPISRTTFVSISTACGLARSFVLNLHDCLLHSILNRANNMDCENMLTPIIVDRSVMTFVAWVWVGSSR